MSSEHQFSGMYRAKVISVDDEHKGGRVQVRVFPMMAEVEDAVLPWATPAFPLFGNMGAWTVPSVGSFVFVFFEAGDFMAPVYFAAAPGKPNMESDDPTEIVLSNEGGNITIKAGGATLKLDSEGKVGLGSSSAEVLDLLNQLLDALQSAVVPTMIGPQNLTPPTLFVDIQTQLAEIMGGV